MKDINDMTPEERTQAWDDALYNFTRLRDATDRMLSLHKEIYGSSELVSECSECGTAYPCRTIRIYFGDK